MFKIKYLRSCHHAYFTNSIKLIYFWGNFMYTNFIFSKIHSSLSSKRTLMILFFICIINHNLNKKNLCFWMILFKFELFLYFIFEFIFVFFKKNLNQNLYLKLFFNFFKYFFMYLYIYLNFKFHILRT